MAKQKSLIPIIHVLALAEDVRTAIAVFKNRVKFALPAQSNVFGNIPAVLPNLDNGCQYYESQVGEARPGDSRRAGKRRLVVEVSQKSREVREIYFTDEHYLSGTFRRVVW